LVVGLYGCSSDNVYGIGFLGQVVVANPAAESRAIKELAAEAQARRLHSITVEKRQWVKWEADMVASATFSGIWGGIDIFWKSASSLK